MLISPRRVMCATVLVLAGLGLCRAALSRYQQQEQAFRQACREQMQKLGLSQSELKAKYPTPEIQLVSLGCLLPGGTAELAVKGKFVPGTKFFIENDNIEVVKETLTAVEYRATLKVPPDIGPQTANIQAITPVSGISAQKARAIAVGGRFEWIMQGDNGWKVVARSAGDNACGAPVEYGADYDLQFFRRGETDPFQKRNAKLYYVAYEKANHQFNINDQPPPGPAQQEMATVSKKLGDPKLTSAQRTELMQRMQKVQADLMAEMKKMSSPAYAKQLDEDSKQFGCKRIDLEVKGGACTGTMVCSPAAGARIAMTGTMKLVGR